MPFCAVDEFVVIIIQKEKITTILVKGIRFIFMQVMKHFGMIVHLGGKVCQEQEPYQYAWLKLAVWYKMVINGYITSCLVIIQIYS